MAAIEDFYRRLGARVAHLRKQKKISQEALGGLLRPPLTRAAISNLETGKQRILALTLVQLAVCLEVSIDDLIGTATMSKSRQLLPAGLAAKLGPTVSARLVAKLQ